MQTSPHRVPKCVLVVGPHRSGTSATSALLHHWGLWPATGDVDVEGDAYNVRGLWEAKRLVEFNDRLLAAAGVSWLTAPTLDLCWLDRLSCRERWVAEAQQLAQDAGAQGDWAWKDPRLCVTLPFWRDLLDACVLLVVRHPVAVAESLRRRNDVPVTIGLALWVLSYWHALAAVEDVPVGVVCFERLVQNPERLMGRLADWLDSQGVRRLDMTENAAELFDRRLVHAEGGPRRLEDEPYRTAMALYERLAPPDGFGAGAVVGDARQFCTDRLPDGLPARVAEGLWRRVQELSPLARGYELLSSHPLVRLGRWVKGWWRR